MPHRLSRALPLIAPAGALLALALLALPAPAADECSLCTPPVADTATAGSDLTLAQWACEAVRTIACDTTDACWIDTILNLVVATSRSVVEHGPPLLACRHAECANGPSALLGIFYAAAAILLALHALHYWFPRSKPVDWHYTLIRIVIGGTLAYLMGAGLAHILWTAAGTAIAIGALFGNEILTSTANVTCNPVDSSVTALGWDATIAVTNALFRNAIDIAATLTGIAMTLLPDLGTLLESYGRMTAGLATMNLEPVFDVLRFMFAFVLLMSAVTIITLFAFTILEALITTSITFALAPLIAVLWIWTGLRTAAHAALSAVLYTALMLAITGITLSIAHRATEASLVQFTQEITNPNYEDDHCPGGPGTLYQSMHYYMCLVNAPDDAQGDPPTLIESSITQWLPALLTIILTTIIAAAVLRYATAAASEITGHQQAHTLAAQVLSQAKSVAGKGMGKLKLR